MLRYAAVPGEQPFCVGTRGVSRGDASEQECDPALTAFSERFLAFEKQLALDAHARQEAHEAEISGLCSNIERLRNTLDGCVERSVVSDRELEGFFERQVASIQENLESTFLDRIDHLYSVADTLNDRLLVVEKEFAHAQKSYLAEFLQRSSAVQAQVGAMDKTLKAECLNRQQREEILVSRVLDLEARTAEKLAHERVMREQKFDLLQEELTEMDRLHAMANRKFEDKAKAWCHKQRLSLTDESRQREQADNEIVVAIQYYTKALQEAVKTSNILP
mmetsp:Transcript_16015/g.36698  ORF Transcript_16015/g.36698 Transcript_16015/m.36698 type:complete len:277 (-) Transcript_16015:26-856(-)